MSLAELKVEVDEATRKAAVDAALAVLEKAGHDDGTTRSLYVMLLVMREEVVKRMDAIVEDTIPE